MTRAPNRVILLGTEYFSGWRSHMTVLLIE